MLQATRDSIHALMLIRAYRIRGHFHAKLDPLDLEPEKSEEELDPRSYGFTEADMDRKIFLDKVLGLEFATMREIVAILRRTYCQTLGVEFMHISDPQQKAWIQERIEGKDKEITFTREGKRAILNKLVEAEGFEKFLDVKFTGTKRFGLDGAESLIPALEQIIKRGGNLGVQEIVFGMAHRGRLNVLTQVMGKPHRVLFHEFKGGSATPDEVEGSGDVKYHLGASSDREFDGNKVHLSLTPNPSHLEIVDPVVLGKVRAKQDQLGATPDRPHHGDAAADSRRRRLRRPGRGGGMLRPVGAEGLPHRRLAAFHRQQPDRLHDLSALFALVALSVRRRQDDRGADLPRQRRRSGSGGVRGQGRDRVPAEIPKPVVIDMFCYRRFGHNEGDEPAFTQPLMYKKIRSHPSTLDIYAKKLIGEGVVTEGEVEKMHADWRPRLEAEIEAGQGYKPNKADWLDGRWSVMKAGTEIDDPRRGNTGVDIAKLKEIGEKITRVPEDFQVHRTIQRFLDNRRKAIETGEGIDWATGEALAFCTLLLDGHPVRLSGQDSERGTFSQRHSVLFDQETEARYTPFNHLSDSAGALRGAELDAVGRGRARLRIRLFDRRAECADAVGSAVRRLRQRRAGGVRPVHLVGRAQMAAHVRPRLPAAAWL